MGSRAALWGLVVACVMLIFIADLIGVWHACLLHSATGWMVLFSLGVTAWWQQGSVEPCPVCPMAALNVGRHSAARHGKANHEQPLAVGQCMAQRHSNECVQRAHLHQNYGSLQCMCHSCMRGSHLESKALLSRSEELQRMQGTADNSRWRRPVS
jgi:hypothetical protein